MKKFAQVLHNKAHWIFEAEEKPEFATNIILVDITNYPVVQEGYDYDAKTGIFTKPVYDDSIIPDPSIEEQILAENQYQTALLEMNMMGAM
ncbi:hypothetical protein [Sporosarcina cyprini]|uniref:hypothetical protein n=1 Tax=Sporosarcina cyprini TaxID=2910523 RepID=UPI001EDD7D65|nr:hypothetical protein [Sporosarcina cyprini]MCG3089119.1 hypothetical protein [Sporosarcina cyprini]